MNQPLVPTHLLIYPNPLSLSLLFHLLLLTHTSFYCLFQPSLTRKGMKNHRKEEESWRVNSKWSRNGRKQDRFSFVLFLTSFQVCPFFCTPMNTPFFRSLFLYTSFSLSLILSFPSFYFLIFFRSSVSKIFLRKRCCILTNFSLCVWERDFIRFLTSFQSSNCCHSVFFFFLSKWEFSLQVVVVISWTYRSRLRFDFVFKSWQGILDWTNAVDLFKEGERNVDRRRENSRKEEGKENDEHLLSTTFSSFDASPLFSSLSPSF